MHKYRSSDEVRDLFLKYFESKNHMIEPGSSLVPVNDDTLLWINSGVAALKKYFDGSNKPKNPRIVNAQKSLRTNDIDNVGKTSRHHTFFEMLGNFSIGDYFKKEALEFAYEFLFSKDWLGLDVSKAYFSVYIDDQEAYDIWVNDIGIDPKRILKTDDNFWQIGEGPCGPNSEIFIDRGEAFDPENLGEKLFFDEMENDRYVEVWNVVFSQYDGKEGVERSEFMELPQKNIDTGMGFERLVSIVQNAETNYDTDLFMPLMNQIEALSQTKYKDFPMAYRVIADHIRTLVFTLSDGAVFSNEGRGYVLRRILRRAVRFGKVISIEGSFLYKLVDTVIESSSHFYPYLKDHELMVKKLIISEEKRFEKTLVSGENLLLDSLKNLESTHHLNGDIAFKLYDTFGFPIELTQEIALEHGFSVDMEGYLVALEAQKERARSSRVKSDSMSSQKEDLMNFNLKSEFLYDVLSVNAEAIGLFVDGVSVDSFSGKGEIIFDKTVFYAESGGQVSDSGLIENDDFSAKIISVNKIAGGQHLHSVNIEDEISLGDQFHLSVDSRKRHFILKNHSAVHLLQAALRTVLGDHVLQAGSFVDEHYFRFDFSHFEKVAEKDLMSVENMLNEWIAMALCVKTEVLSIDEAKATGAMALFSENYGETVRVVSMGDVSKELCGGTHVHNTAEIGLIKLLSEESVGSGVRRIQGLVSLDAIAYLEKYKNEQEQIRKELKLPKQKTVSEGVFDLVSSLNTLKEENKNYKLESMNVLANELSIEYQNINEDLKYIWFEQVDLDMDLAKVLVEKMREKIDIVVCAIKRQSSLNFVVACSPQAIKEGFKAGDLAKIAAITTGGNGGGRPNFAESGGKNIDDLASAEKELASKVGLAF